MSALYQTEGQGAIWILFATAGFAAAFLTDAFLSCADGGLARVLAGILAGAATAALAAAVCFYAANGSVRLYMLMGMAGGASLYFATLGALLHRLAALAYRLILAIYRRVSSWRFVQRLTK